MMCERCGQSPATVHMKQVINDDKRESHLCVDCATEEAVETGISWPAPSFHQLLGGLLGSESPWSGYAAGGGGGVRCPNCGLSFADFRRLGHFGCSECYVTFAEPLEPVLRRIQGGTTHTGKIPTKAAGALQLRRQREQLESELQELVAREEYEQAAILRDKLRALEQRGMDRNAGKGVRGTNKGNPQVRDDRRQEGG